MLLRLAFVAAVMILIVPAKWVPAAIAQQPALALVLEWRAPLQHKLVTLRAELPPAPKATDPHRAH